MVRSGTGSGFGSSGSEGSAVGLAMEFWVVSTCVLPVPLVDAGHKVGPLLVVGVLEISKFALGTVLNLNLELCQGHP
jgi:hypothetical protein